jgi:hypothetical protein
MTPATGWWPDRPRNAGWRLASLQKIARASWNPLDRRAFDRAESARRATERTAGVLPGRSAVPPGARHPVHLKPEDFLRLQTSPQDVDHGEGVTLEPSRPVLAVLEDECFDGIREHILGYVTHRFREGHVALPV